MRCLRARQRSRRWLSGYPDAGVAGDTAAVLHGLYWLTSNVAAAGPLALIVDDAHWSDRASLEWLVYLARRVDDLPVVLVVGYRPDEPGAASDLLSQLAGEPRGRRLEAIASEQARGGPS